MFDKSEYAKWKKIIRKVIKDITNNYPLKEDMIEDLVQAGMIGLIKAEKNYAPDKGASLTTYAYNFIKGEIIAELKNAPGDLPSFDDEENGLANTVAYRSRNESEKLTDEAPREKSAEEKKHATYRLAVHLLNALKACTDEEHTVSQSQLHDILNRTPGATAKNRQTVAQALSALIEEVNINGTKKIAYNEDASGRKSDYRYVHELSYKELDTLIEAVFFSGSISDEDKRVLVEKIIHLASVYYEYPFFDKRTENLRTNDNAVFSRTYKTNVGENIRAIQNAMNNDERISFMFNAYTADKTLSPLPYRHELSPYQIVVYHDMYYLIGGKEGCESLSHYRIDLMCGITSAKDNDGNIKTRESMAKYRELRDNMSHWQPDKYMSEHLYMGYDKPRRIRIKIKNDKYTVLHDRFGDKYEKSFTPCEDGYDYVYIVTSPSMLVHWALQYADIVEVMDVDIRREIRKQIKNLEGKYNG